MRNDAIKLEEERLKGFKDLSEYDQLHERHRVFPEIFENRDHNRVIDLSAGMGVVARNIRDGYNCELITNDISPKCLKSLRAMGHKISSFNLDDPGAPFPFADGYFDAVITLATIEHLFHIDHFIQEIHRILKPGGVLYISAPNYSGLPYLLPFLVTGKAFHDPLCEKDKYEFYAHIRYFTFRTLMEFVRSFDFSIDTVYVPLPSKSSKFQRIRKRSKVLAVVIRLTMKAIYAVGTPRWASEPILCFRKGGSQNSKYAKKIL